ncbi:MarR family winged helix-turn-helix transcriptional regulator [Methanococcoides sp.]|jgi:DNA-binding MarR family transcriptional regulator|uniref:MarR family winged helix-turn-helix transcriptional regulator n=1 Tax=Methanococcoides sp. TaxID=1966350 RepID=UPI00272E5CEA|nr:MarR family transcriptional regulator [Methanococcoides sp.]
MHDKEFIGKYISYFHRYAQIYIEKELKPYDIGSGQFGFLMHLYKMNGVNQETLSQTIKVDKATATRAIKKLIEEGYVFRQSDKEDRRSYLVFLTEKGRAIEPDMKKIAAKWENILLSDFDDSQRKFIMDLLEKMFKNVSKIM